MDRQENEIVLTDQELAQLQSETWKQLKTDPNASRKFLVEAGWISKRFSVTD
jgi:hypothetical protein